jgi:tetratricopeptide (TPR) repeat protein
MLDGHADAAAVRAAGQRTDAVVELAQLWIEPMHREDDAADLLEVLLRISPGHPRAVLLSGYLALHYWTDSEHLDRAAAQLREVLAARAEIGAAALLLDEILRRDNSTPDLDLLHRSVSAEPSWSLNHVRLARAYTAVGRPAAALAEWDIAIANILEPDTPLDPLTESFHTLFTGCLNTRSRLVAERAALERSPLAGDGL